MHTDRQTYRHTDIQTYRHTDIQTYRHTDIHTYIHIYIYIHTHMHIHIHIHTYIHCEWELGYSITHVPMYIAFIFPLPRGHNCRPFGSSTTAGPPRKQPSCRSCESPVVVSESKSPQYQQGTYISERISDSQVISRRSPTEPTSG